MRSPSLLLVAFLAATPLAAQARPGLSLAEVYARLTAASPRLRMAAARAEAAHARIKPAGRWPDPELQLGLMNRDLPRLGLNEVLGMNQVQVMQMVPTAGKTGLAVKAARASASAEDAVAREATWEVRAAGAMSFHELRQAEASLGAMRDARQLLADILRTTEAMYAAGQGRQADVLRAQVEVARMDDELLAMTAMRDGARARLAALLGLGDDEALPPLLAPGLPDTLPAREALVALALGRRPMLEAGAARVTAGEAMTRMAGRELWPDVTLGLVYGNRPMPMGGWEHMASFMVGFTLPLTPGSRQRQAEAEARHDAHGAGGPGRHAGGDPGADRRAARGLPPRHAKPDTAAYHPPPRAHRRRGRRTRSLPRRARGLHDPARRAHGGHHHPPGDRQGRGRGGDRAGRARDAHRHDSLRSRGRTRGRCPVTSPSTVRTALVAVAIVGAAGAATWYLTRSAPAPAPAGGHNHAAMTGGGAGEREVRLSDADQRRIGVTFAPVAAGPLEREVRVVAQVAFDESRMTVVTPRTEGYVEKLHASFTGQQVRAGQPLLEMHAPMLTAAAEEYLLARRLEADLAGGSAESRANAGRLTAAARDRLRLFGLPEQQLEHLEHTGAPHGITLYAPSSGVILEKNVVEGQRVMMGDPLFRIADLGTVWLEGDVFEQDLGTARLGTEVTAEFTALPGQPRHGRISYVAPSLNLETRTGRIRVALANPGLVLKPGMFATLRFTAPAAGRTVLSVPRSAVLSTGQRNLVFVKRPDGRFTPPT
ncbi:MAG: efflux RND transporter periplasmic adaptor subunit [Gemmatimonadetes bacterium]|nr:efflux RND transporter periplasmic adaptor subunit [Gemmatimonadota bacterium]